MSADVQALPAPVDSANLAKPIHIQKLEQALRLDPLLTYVEKFTKPNRYGDTDTETSTDADTDYDIDKQCDADGNKTYNGVVVSRAERKADKSRLYNFSKVKKGRKWLKNVLLSDTSCDEDSDEDGPLKKEDMHAILKQYKSIKKYRDRFQLDKDLLQYQYYSVGLLSNHDKYLEHQKLVLGPRRKALKEQKRLEKKLKKVKLKNMCDVDGLDGECLPELGRPPKEIKGGTAVSRGSGPGARTPKVKKVTPEQMLAKRRRLWISLSKKEIPKQQKSKLNARKENMSNLKKVAKECQKECRRAALQSQKMMKEAAIRARRLSKEMMVYWKRFEKVEKEHRKRAEKEAQEQRKMDLELLEMKRQQRKLNFLITQTELYAHFVAGKMTGQTDKDRDKILSHLDEEPPASSQKSIDGTTVTDVIGDNYDSQEMKEIAIKNAEEALLTHKRMKNSFDAHPPAPSEAALTGLANPAISTEVERSQPTIFQGRLKSYQLKGMNWLANLYDQGINGILADEMGLGKTVQSIALLAFLCETLNIWGPFLIVAPASTLHNWQQEVSRFFPKLKVVPYWGNTQDRKILRKFWNQDNFQTEDASFHMVITSYQLIIQDVKYFQRIRWHYMILDEAQAIKSTASTRWKVLLGFSCHNRLLLTGTPIQNSMAELWALLHFIMPTLFDSHEEFNEWFSKDIESHAEKQSGIDEDQLSRLHMILKPFMLRRVKKDVENELSDKIEILVYCPFTLRQKLLYQGIKNKISIEDLIQSSMAGSSQAQNSTSSLMNLVMQFRKVCNHPELFERRDIRSPCCVKLPPYLLPKLIYREGLLDVGIPSKRHLLFNMLYIYSPDHVHHSLFPQNVKDCSSSCFSYTRFIDLSPAELYGVMLKGMLYRWLLMLICMKKACHIRYREEWDQTGLKEVETRYMNNKSLLLSPCFPTSAATLLQSSNLQKFTFTSTLTTYAFLPHNIHYIPETITHRNIRLFKHTGKADGAKSPTRKKLPVSPTAGSRAPLSQFKKHPSNFEQEQILPHKARPLRKWACQPTPIPSFLFEVFPKVRSPRINIHCCDRSASWDNVREKLCGTLEAKTSLLYGTPEIAEQVRWSKWYFSPTAPQGLMAIQPITGFSGVIVPDKEVLVTDAGKLFVLDTLLERLKNENHRVLIYSQMTRMIDILEEYMWHRKHTYMRLDGSSKISDRRDMVADFQTRTDIFVFLLSTRAGGLGINLTAADTVIFYDSDWNPTIDQQAMDRAHRLGQTKQVTVYRLICNGTIEERILERAREKSEIQRMVISGGNYRPDTLKPKEVVSLLLDDDDMEKKLRQRQEEKKVKEDEKGRERKRKPYCYIPGVGRPRTGRGPGRPPKRLKMEEEQNTTIATPDVDYNISMDSISATASPQSVLSAGSEATQNSMLGDESSNDALVIVDDSSQSASTPATASTKRGRPRGRPRGSGIGRRPRGRGSVQKALGAAEAAAAQSAKKAAYEAYGYSFSDNGASPTLKTIPANFKPTRRGRGRGRGSHQIHRPIS